MPRSSFKARKLWVHQAALSSFAGIVTGVWLLRRFPPAENNFYPRCLFFETFHLLCPGCGATRALAAMAHGNLFEAMHRNAAIVVATPLVILFWIISYYRAVRHIEFRWPLISDRTLTIFIAVVLAFGVLRNLVTSWHL